MIPREREDRPPRRGAAELLERRLPDGAVGVGAVEKVAGALDRVDPVAIGGPEDVVEHVEARPPELRAGGVGELPERQPEVPVGGMDELEGHVISFVVHGISSCTSNTRVGDGGHVAGARAPRAQAGVERVIAPLEPGDVRLEGLEVLAHFAVAPLRRAPIFRLEGRVALSRALLEPLAELGAAAPQELDEEHR